MGGLDYFMAPTSFGDTGCNLDFLDNMFMSIFLSNHCLSIDTVGSYLNFVAIIYYYVLNVNNQTQN